VSGNWLVAVGNGVLGLYERSYKVRLSYIEGGATEIDNLIFDAAVPVEHTTWGALKAMYTE
jgi:hypothetical protein